MRLIDADALISFIDPEHLRHSGELTFSEIDVINMLNHAPTAYDVDKVVEMLEEECFSPIDYPGYAVDIEKAIEIVEEGGVDEGKRGKSEDAEELRSNSETTSKWVPCSEKLPKKPEVDGYFDGYIVQTRRVSQPFSAYWDGKEWTDDDDDAVDDVIAWMPLPEPYREGRDDE